MSFFSPSQQQLLESFLSSDAVSESCLDYIACHGFLTGIVCGPEELQSQDYLSVIFDGEVKFGNQQQAIVSAINDCKEAIEKCIYLGESLTFPCKLMPPNNEQTNSCSDWCFGFMEAVAMDEECWFQNPELTGQVAELILPMGVISGSFDEPELQQLLANKQDAMALTNAIPDNINELYLVYRET
jgi:uncharacterized protein